MEKVDILIENGTVITLDDRSTILQNAYLCVRGGTISHLGTEGIGNFLADKTIDAQGGLILPGLINGHTHAAMSLFRGLADDLPLMDWLNHYIFPAEAGMDSDFVYAGSLLAMAEMILSGTTTFCDMYLFERDVARAAVHAGMRCLIGEVLYDFPSPNYGPLENGFAYTEDLIREWKDHPLVSIAVEPHSLFTCSPSLLRRADEIARRHNVPLIIHLAETSAETEAVRERYGRPPVEHLCELGLLGPHVIADHCVHLEKGEIRVLAAKGVKVIHNPESNMKLASGIAPVPEMLRCGITVGLGTDGCASNNDLDLFSEMDSAAKLHKVNTLDPTVLDAETVLRMATVGNAGALGMGNLIGSLEVGKKADVIVVDTNRPHLTPLYNPYSQLVYAAAGSDVSHSIINGRLVMEDRRLLTLNPGEIMARAEEKAEEVKGRISRKELHPGG